MYTRRGLGTFGEEQASLFLKRNGFDILAKNIFTPYGEVDIVAYEISISQMVFVEVKTRLNYSTPESAITSKKIKSMNRSACFFMLKNGLFVEDFRFDVVSVCIFINSRRMLIKHFRAWR